MDGSILLITADPSLSAPVAAVLRSHGLRVTSHQPDQLPPPEDLQAAVATIADAGCGPAILTRIAAATPVLVVLGDRDRADQLLGALHAGARDFLARDAGPEEIEAVLARVPEGSLASPAYLEYRTEDGAQRVRQLQGSEFLIGRDPASDLSIGSAVVSRLHARIIWEGDRYKVVDCGSRHGLFVDNQRVETAMLEDGAVIRLGKPGSPVITFRASPPTLMEAPEGGGEDVSGRTVLDSNQEMRDIAGLLDTFLKLNGNLVLDDVLEIVLARSIELADAERGLILLADEGPGGYPVAGDPTGQAPVLHPAMARDRNGTPIGEQELEISRRVPEQVIQTGRGVIISDLLAPGEGPSHPSMLRIGLRSALCVPLRVRPGDPAATPQILGVLYVDSTNPARTFSERLLHALESLASEAAQAISSSRLYKVCLEKREMDAEMRIAQAIQKNLLPPESFANEWMELQASSAPSKEVGGDLLSYFPLGPEAMNLAVGDVSGKGIPAALFSSLLDGLCFGLDAQPRAALDLGTLAARINRHLTAKSRLEKFASLFFGNLRRDGRFLYVNAGHNPPLHVKAGGRIDLLRTGGMILGMIEEAEYRHGEALVARGDLVLIYSDGVTEARDRRGDLFGLERLKRAATELREKSAREVHDGVLERVRHFLAGTPAGDDVTLMAVKVL